MKKLTLLIGLLCTVIFLYFIYRYYKPPFKYSTIELPVLAFDLSDKKIPNRTRIHEGKSYILLKLNKSSSKTFPLLLESYQDLANIDKNKNGIIGRNEQLDTIYLGYYQKESNKLYIHKLIESGIGAIDISYNSKFIPTGAKVTLGNNTPKDIFVVKVHIPLRNINITTKY